MVKLHNREASGTTTTFETSDMFCPKTHILKKDSAYFTSIIKWVLKCIFSANFPGTPGKLKGPPVAQKNHGITPRDVEKPWNHKVSRLVTQHGVLPGMPWWPSPWALKVAGPRMQLWMKISSSRAPRVSRATRQETRETNGEFYWFDWKRYGLQELLHPMLEKMMGCKIWPCGMDWFWSKFFLRKWLTRTGWMNDCELQSATGWLEP